MPETKRKWHRALAGLWERRNDPAVNDIVDKAVRSAEQAAEGLKPHDQATAESRSLVRR